MEKAIDIGTVLARFNDTYNELELQVNQYGIRFITSDGRLRTMICRKNVKSPRQQLRAPQHKRAKGLFNLQRHGTILLEDMKRNDPRTVKVAAICEFGAASPSGEVKTWLRVRH